MWLRGVRINPGEIQDIPGITRPEIMLSDLRTRVQIVTKKKVKPKPVKVKEKVTPKETPTIYMTLDEDEPKKDEIDIKEKKIE